MSAPRDRRGRPGGVGIRLAVVCWLLSSLLPSPSSASPSIALAILDTDPASPATLHNGDTVYLRIEYSSDVPLRIWVEAYQHGKPAAAGAMTNPSPVYPAGEGEAFGWFAFRGTATVDQIHLQAAPASARRTPTVDEPEPANFTWDGQPGAMHERAAWVGSWQKKQAAAEQQDYDHYMKTPLGVAGDIALVVFGILVMGALAACFLWPVWGLIRWRGKWRALAALPLLLVGWHTLTIITDLSADPTSHNLLPFEYLELAVIVLPYMIVVWLFRRAARRTEAAV
jgi:hypothetical protein